MKTLLRGCLLLIVACFFLGCGVNTITFFVIPTIHQTRWNELKPKNYSLTVNYGYLGQTWLAYEESVMDGFAQRQDLSQREPSIDKLFADIKGQTLNPFGLLLLYDTEYDPIYHFPIRIVWNDFDLGDVIEIKDFTPQ